MAEPDLLITAGFSDAKLAQESQKLIAKYKQIGDAAQKAFKDSTDKVSDNQALRAHLRELDRALRTYDPVYVATKKYEGEVKKLNSALALNAISQDRYNDELKQAQIALNQASGAIQVAAQRAGSAGGQFQNVGYQIQDFAVQVGAGTSATQAFAQQFPQLASAFGPVGVGIGTVAAILVPLSAAFLSASADSKSLDERLDDLAKTTDAMTAAIEAAATPISDLRARYGELADEVARANGAMAMMATIRAQADALGAANSLGAPFRDLNIDIPDISAGDTGDGIRRDQLIVRQRQAMDELLSKTGATEEQFERLRMAINRTNSSNSLEAVARDAENLLTIIAELYTDADDKQRKFLSEWASQVTATMNSAKQQIAAQVAEENRLFDTYDQNTRKLEGLADDRAAAEAGLAQAVRDGNEEKIASYQRVIAAIDAEVVKVKDSIDQIDGSFGALVSRLRERAGEIGGAIGGAIGGVFDRYTGPGMGAVQTIKDFEGFRSKAYWDVNAYRAGFGSDTVTRADGSIERVTKDTIVTLADANRDLARRIGEFQAAIIGEIGPGRWSEFTQEQQAALTSIAYNYGSLPDRIIEAVRTGTSQDIATAIGRLSGDNNGVNEGRRMREASAFGTISAAAREYRASQQAAAEAARAAAERERIAAAGSDALDRALRQAMQLHDISAQTVDVVNNQESAWDAVGQTILSAAQAGEDLDDVLKRLALSLADMAMQAAFMGQGPLSGVIPNLFGGSAAGTSLFSFDGGGFTGYGGRVGGIDGKGGFSAILHPNETVIDHTRGQRLGGGSQTMVIDLRGTTGDAALDAKMRAAGERILMQAKAQAPGWVADHDKRNN